ncbi:MAG TPA: PAS domain S-box protein [Gammaproteobacteria bacterium]
MFTRLFSEFAGRNPSNEDAHRPYRLLVDSVVDHGLCMLDVEGRVISWNQAATQITGFSHAEVIGEYFATLFAHDTSETGRYRFALQSARETGHHADEITCTLADGRTCPVEVVLSPMRDEYGVLRGYALVLRNISDSGSSEPFASVTQVPFDLLVNSVTEYAIFMLDTEGRIASWNAGAERINGYRAEEVTGRHFSIFYPIEDVKNGMPQHNLGVAAETGRFEGEGWRVRRNGELFWASVAITALYDHSGSLRGFGKVTRDLTQHYRTTIAPLPTGVLLLGPDGSTFACNAHASRLLHVPEQELLGRLPTDFGIRAIREDGTEIPEDDLPSRITLTTGVACRDVVLGIVKDGSETHWVSVDTDIFEMDSDRRPLSVVVSMHDISKLKRSQDMIRRGEQLFRSLVEASSQIVWNAGPDGALLDVSNSFETLTGKPRMQARGWHWLEAVHPADRDQVRIAWRDAIGRAESFEVECRLLLHDQSTRFYLLRGVPVNSDDGTVREWVGTLSDIDARKRYEQELEHRANHDELTGLASRNVLTDRFEQAIAHADRASCMTAVLFLDLDNFKEINDKLGHQYGDELLRVLAQRLAGSIRTGDTVARVGGDEFVIVLTQLKQPDDVRSFYNKLLRIVSAPLRVTDRDLAVTVSVGAAVYPRDGVAVPELLRHADLAMYSVKKQGRNGLAFYMPDMDNQA